MITNLTPSSALFLANLNRIEENIAQANAEVSSGRKINVASDDPDQLQNLLQLRTDQSQNTQIQANLTLAQTDASGADNALTAAIQLMDRAVTLATQGANDTTTAAGRQSIAQEIAGIQQQMVSYANTQVQGRYIFSGDEDGKPSYQLDLNAAKGVDQLIAPSATRKVQDSAGGSFSVSMTAPQIFDASGSSVFGALNQLRTALLADNSTAIGNALSAIQNASDYLNQAQSFYGNVEKRIQEAQSFSSQYDTQLQTEIGGLQDADVTRAALELTQSNTNLQAAFEMQGKMPTTSLFNYLG